MNIYKRLVGILPSQRVDVGTVIQNFDDAVLVQLQTGQTCRVIGSGQLNTRVYIKNGVVVGSAPDLSGVTIEV